METPNNLSACIGRRLMVHIQPDAYSSTNRVTVTMRLGSHRERMVLAEFDVDAITAAVLADEYINPSTNIQELMETSLLENAVIRHAQKVMGD